MIYDLILRGGRIIDPSQKLDEVIDLAFAAGKVARIGAGLKADTATDVRELSGAIVTPGLIDLHTHVYAGGTSLGVGRIPHCRSCGVLMFHLASLEHHVRDYGDGWRGLFVCAECELVTCNATGWN